MAGKWFPVSPVPGDAPEPPAAHLVRGKPEQVFQFHTNQGLVGYLYRFERSDGSDRDLPLSYCVNDIGTTMEWRWVSFELPRPLYGPMKQPWLLYPDSAIVLTDDPACVDAGHELVPALRFCAWIGGLSAIKKTDWKILQARTVWLWPTGDVADSDQPNLRAMKQLASLLVKQGCTVKMIDTSKDAPGWNLASAKAENWDPTDLMSWMTEHANTVFSRKVFTAESIPTPRLASAVHHAEWRERMQLIHRKGEPAECYQNVIEYLLHHPDWQGVLAWDEFANKIVKRKPPPWEGALSGDWIDGDFVSLGRWLAHREDLLIRAHEHLVRAVVFVAERSTFHPVRDFVKAQRWDKTPRIDKWLADFMGAEETEYTALAGRYFFINLIRRVFEPGCIMRSVVVLIGPQNLGKSTALAVIGGEWFADTMFVVGDKDAYQVLRGKLLYEISEFHSFGKAEATRVKAFVSSPVDTYRASYGQNAKDWPRQVSFAASTNSFEIFTDMTGGTRFHPVVTHDINLDGLREQRAQLYAEAYHRYLAGEKAYADAATQKRVFDPVNERHEVEHPWLPDIREFLRPLSGGEVTLNQILYKCIGIERNKLNPAQQEVKTVVAILQRLGCKRERQTSGAREWYYRVPDFKALEKALDNANEPGCATGTDDDEPF